MDVGSSFEKSKKIILDELSRIRAADIMIPRSDVVMIDRDLGLDEILKIVVEDGHSRFPVYYEQIDNILGVLYVKDLLKYFGRKDFNIEEILKKAIFVPENKLASELLRDFKRERIHLAIVVNEYGTMVGIVSLEDIIEEIFGEIEDEYDSDTFASYKKISKNEFIIFPKMKIDEFNSIFKTKLTSENFDTIGGFVLEYFGYVPKPGESFDYGGYNFRIESVDGSKIKEILLKKK
ncbi:MAG: transporter associated domain-containing protein [Brevinematia bacterium]